MGKKELNEAVFYNNFVYFIIFLLYFVYTFSRFSLENVFNKTKVLVK